MTKNDEAEQSMSDEDFEILYRHWKMYAPDRLRQHHENLADIGAVLVLMLTLVGFAIALLSK